MENSIESEVPMTFEDAAQFAADNHARLPESSELEDPRALLAKARSGELPYGTRMDGGFYAGRILIDEQPYALIVAPKAEGDHDDHEWINDITDVPGALSYNDGLANTKAMAAAGSDLAQWALDLRIAGHADWYIPAVDEIEVIYRNLKPGTRENYCWVRSGINMSAIPPTHPYTPEFPAQTLAEAFQAGGAEAFKEAWYWTSTRFVADKDYAWCQHFIDGSQYCGDAFYELRARAVRRSPI